MWDIQDCTENSNFTDDTPLELRKHELPESWLIDHVRHDLKNNNILNDLAERLVIEWGAATISWVQTKDKEIVELKGKKYIGDFQSSGQINLNFWS